MFSPNFSLHCENNSDNLSLFLPAQCLSPRWWLLWSCHICYPGHCSGTSHSVAALLSTLLDSRWLYFSTFVPVAGVRELWFDTGSVVGCFAKCSNTVEGDLVRWCQTDVFEIPLERGSEGSNLFQQCLLRDICVLRKCCPLSCTANVSVPAEMKSRPLLI